MRNLSVLLLIVSSSLYGSVLPGPHPVSPGLGETPSVTTYRCPTFSWSGVPGAWGYELAIFKGSEDPSSAQPLVSVRVPAHASSWTPSLDQCLEPDSRYTWYVRELGGLGRRDGSWSAGSRFDVAALEDVAGNRDLRPTVNERFTIDNVHNWLTDNIGSSGSTTHGSRLAKVSRWQDDAWAINIDQDSLGTRLYQARNYARGISDWKDGVGNLEDVKSAATELLGIMQEGQQLRGEDGSVQALIEDMTETFQFTAAREMEGKNAFLFGEPAVSTTACAGGTPCAEFRRNLTEVVLGLQSSASLLRQPAGEVVDLQQIVDLFDEIPPVMLFAVYRADESVGLIDHGIARINRLNQALQVVLPVLTSPPAGMLAAAGAGGSSGDPCAAISANETLFDMAIIDLRVFGVSFSVAGGLATFISQTLIVQPEGQIHGYAGATIKVDGTGVLGKGLEKAGEISLKLADAASAMKNNCRIHSKLDQIVAGLPGEESCSLETVETRLTAIESGIAALQTERIERHIASCEPMVSLILPALQGGQAEAVAQLVRDAIDRAAAAGLKTKDAEVHYSRGVGEQSSGAWPKAFQSLCNAYGALTNGG